LIYGMSAYGLTQSTELTLAEAETFVETYFKQFPGIADYLEKIKEQAKEKGYVETLLGRRRYFPTINASNRGLRTAAERAAINMPIQGTAADMMKLAMIRVHNRMKKEGLQSLMMLQVHDELVFEAPLSEVDTLACIAKEEMERALPLDLVPIIVETGSGVSWYEAH